ncbi:hypothetical protein B0H66DRAFT_608572 [Apodospora peruviana]|uniref:Uncharacterized protein n=1 Tax=Apodospora peruviana TaxID=516989 RepID=A0AAE0HSY4_9PEZI|nr:hypothetical protein B0H66DRAFT_608572 [Apodospora peruviana]
MAPGTLRWVFASRSLAYSDRRITQGKIIAPLNGSETSSACPYLAATSAASSPGHSAQHGAQISSIFGFETMNEEVVNMRSSRDEPNHDSSWRSEFIFEEVADFHRQKAFLCPVKVGAVIYGIFLPAVIGMPKGLINTFDQMMKDPSSSSWNESIESSSTGNIKLAIAPAFIDNALKKAETRSRMGLPTPPPVISKDDESDSDSGDDDSGDDDSDID